MDGTFVSALREEMAEPHIVEIDGQRVLMAPPDWTQQRPPLDEPSSITVGTLMGLHDYLEANIDRLDKAKLMLRISGPDAVELVGAIGDELARYSRWRYVRASAARPSFALGSFLEYEAFVIGIQTCFVDTAERAELLTFLGSVRESSVRETVDDGLSQEVKTAKGITRVDNTRVPNPVWLAPFRTFDELDQPVSAFVLRLRQGEDASKPRAALFEADGGAWKREAIERTAVWLRANIEGVAVVS